MGPASVFPAPAAGKGAGLDATAFVGKRSLRLPAVVKPMMQV